MHRLPSRPTLTSFLGGAEDGARLSSTALPKKLICRLEHAPTHDEDEEAGAAVVSVAFAESGWCSTGWSRRHHQGLGHLRERAPAVLLGLWWRRRGHGVAA